MFFAGIITFLCSFILLFIHQKNKMYRVFSIYFLSIALLIITSSTYISKTHTYPYYFKMDYNLFLLFSSLKIPFMMLYRAYLFSLCLFMLTPMFYYKLLNKRSTFVFICCFTVISIIFILLNDPELSWDFYRYKNTLKGNNLLFINSLIQIRLYYNKLTMSVCMLIPIFLLLRYSFRSKIKRNRTDAFIFCFSVILIDILMYFIILKGFFKAINFSNIGLTGFPTITPQYYTQQYIPIIFLSVLLTIFLLTVLYKPLSEYIIIQKSTLKQSSKFLNKNLHILVHNYKNAFTCISEIGKMAQQNLGENNTEKCNDNLNVLIEVATKQLESIQKSLTTLSNPTFSSSVFSIEQCINEASKSFVFDENVTFSIKNKVSSTLVVGDIDLFREVFINLFSNSVQAIKEKGDTGAITVTIDSEDSYLIIDFTDTGIGIQSKDIKHIFTPFYTTKPLTKNSGLGLAYVEKTVRSHKGYVEVHATKNSKTTFRIILPSIEKNTKKLNYQNYNP